jgi:serine protease Do
MTRSKAVLILALVAAFIAGCIVPGRKDDPSASARQSAAPGLDLARQLNEAFVSVAEQVSPSVVVLEVTERPTRGRRGGFRSPSMGEGSGIIVSKDGYILTNHHIVDNADKIKVYLRDGHSFDAEVRGTDPKTDIAVVKIKPGGVNLQVARLGDSDKLRVGEFVLAIGHPLDLPYSVTVGHVSAVARQLSTDSYADTPDDQEYIQTDAVINPGNSGGPLVNLSGEVIAVNAMMEGYRDPITGFTQNRGIGLSIPINEARVVEDRLISDGKFIRSNIGIPLSAQHFRDALSLLGQEGVEVLNITPKGPADKAGLKTNDVIIAVDGMPVKTARDFRNMVGLKKPGQSITITVKRDSSSKPLPFKVITVADTASTEDSLVSISSGRSNTPGRASSYNSFGFAAKALTKDLAQQFGVDSSSGVIVTDVTQFNQLLNGVATLSQAYVRDINPGDIIVKMNNKNISTIEDYNKALKAVAPGEALTMELNTKDGPKFKVLRAPASE